MQLKIYFTFSIISLFFIKTNEISNQERKIMDLLQSIHKLPVNEKLQLMEFLWEELSANETEFVSPKWHKTALAETEKRAKEGQEEFIDWSTAKDKLRKKFK